MYIAPGSGRAMRAPTGCAFGDGVFDVDTERADVGIGPYGVPSARVHPTQRCSTGGHKGRPYSPAPDLPVGAGFMPARTGFCRGVDLPPWQVRSAMVRPTRRCARAAIKAAPTDPLPAFP